MRDMTYEKGGSAIFILRGIGGKGIDAIKIKIDGAGKDYDAVCDKFERIINEKGLTREVINAPVTVGDATGVIIAVDDNRFCSGGGWHV